MKGRSRTFKASEIPYREYERCSNPWNGGCGSTEIQLYIYYDGERLPICRSCWSEIAAEDFEWSMDEPKNSSRSKVKKRGDSDAAAKLKVHEESLVGVEVFERV